MLFRLFFEGYGEIVLYIYDNGFCKRLKEHFTSPILNENDKIIFQTEISYNKGKYIKETEQGMVGYSPRNREIVIFYGFSQPRKHIVKLGKVVGPTYYLRWIENNISVHVSDYRDYGELGRIASILRNKGFIAGSREWENTNSIVLLAFDTPLEIFLEENIFTIETAPLFPFDNSSYASVISDKLKIFLKYSRLDINKDYYIVLSMLSNHSNLYNDIWIISHEYKYIRKILKSTLL